LTYEVHGPEAFMTDKGVVISDVNTPEILEV